MKYTTFTIKDNNTSNNINSGSTNYSSMLDSLILSNIKKTTPYIFTDYKKNEPITTFKLKKYTGIDPFIAAMLSEHGDYTPESLSLKDIDYIKAAKYLANYKKSDKIKFGKVYHLADGTPIIFFKDEVQIGFDAYDYDDLLNIDFLNGLTTDKKDMIINIVININL